VRKTSKYLTEMDHDAVIEVRRFTYQKSRSSSTLDFGVPNSQRRLGGKLSSRGSLVSSSFFFVSSRYFDETCSHIVSKVVCRIYEGTMAGERIHACCTAEQPPIDPEHLLQYRPWRNEYGWVYRSCSTQILMSRLS
jgi:hypothetical protein